MRIDPQLVEEYLMDTVVLPRDVVERAERVLDTLVASGLAFPESVCRELRDALRDALRGAEPESVNGEPPGGWVRQGSHFQLGHAEPYATCSECPPLDPMPEPTSGSVVVTIDGRDVNLLNCRCGWCRGWASQDLLDLGHGLNASHTWQQVLDARDPGTQIIIL